MAHKKELSYNLRLLADTPRKATAKSRLLSSSERPYLEDIQEQRLELASYQLQVALTNQLHKVLLQAMFLFIWSTWVERVKANSRIFERSYSIATG